mgnify:CR=1 FL=1
MSWWIDLKCQKDRTVFLSVRDGELPRMLADPHGKRVATDYLTSYARNWGPLPYESKQKLWKQRTEYDAA